MSACCSQLYRSYVETIKKNWIIDFKMEYYFFEIRIICNYLDIDSYEECNIVNELYENNNILFYGHNNFFKEMCAINKSYDSMFIFTSNKL